VPLYEYQCKKCERLTERIVKFSDPPLTVCPHCGGEMEQLISAPAVQFKGSGWYVTDYAKSGKSGKADSSGKSDSASSGNGTSTSSEAKADAKSDAAKSEGSKSDSSKPDTSKSSSSTSKDSK
jgi:putative FmdB family regulatory protein